MFLKRFNDVFYLCATYMHLLLFMLGITLTRHFALLSRAQLRRIIIKSMKYLSKIHLMTKLVTFPSDILKEPCIIYLHYLKCHQDKFGLNLLRLLMSN